MFQLKLASVGHQISGTTNNQDSRLKQVPCPQEFRLLRNKESNPAFASIFQYG